MSQSEYPPEFDARQRILEDPHQQKIKARRKCLDAGFLAEQTDPWKLETSEHDSISHRDATLGDGFLGIHVSPDGDASAYTQGSQHFCYGLRDRSNGSRAGVMRQLPLFATLQLSEIRYRHGRPHHKVLEFHQSQDLFKARVDTKRRIQSIAGEVEVSTGVYLPLQHQGVVVLEMELSPLEGEWWRVEESLSTKGVEDVDEISFREDEDGDLVVTGRMGDHHFAIVSRLVGWPSSQNDGDGVSHQRWADLRLDSKLKLAKVVAIAGGEWGSDPLAAAKEKVGRASVDLGQTRREHEALWAKRWSRGLVMDHPALQTLTRAAMFQLLCLTREELPAGIPPCGLTGKNWSGSVFWDLDTWMQHPLDFFHPDLGRSLCQFRIQGLGEAQQRAEERGYGGADYPWQSAHSGVPLITKEVGELQRHVTAGVARSLWHHYRVSGDLNWLREKAWPVFRETAEYWRSRATPLEGGGMTIAGVKQADEYAPKAQCHALTNAAAAWNLHRAAKVAVLIGETPHPRWQELADALVIPRDQ